MNKSNRTAGFGVIEIILIVVLLALIGIFGYYVYTKNQQSQNSQKTTSSSSDKSSSAPTPAPTQPSVSYTTIKEWGVKVPDQPSGNVVSYQISSSDPNTAFFVSSEQKALGGTCGTFAMSRYEVIRMTTGAKASEPVLQAKLDAAAQNNQTVQIGTMTYYIVKDMSGGDCIGNGQVTQQETTANNNLLNALKGLVVAS